MALKGIDGLLRAPLAAQEIAVVGEKGDSGGRLDRQRAEALRGAEFRFHEPPVGAEVHGA
ncbi:MAG: hypothetical protein K5Q68_08820 [Roseococcus sp.]|nr:hypothetical protein [Roseococcus sp.]